jgi:hypothetical protein
MPYTDMELGQYNLYLLRRLHLCQGGPAGLSRRSVGLMPQNRRNNDQTERVVGKVIGRTDVQTSGISGSAVVSAPYPYGRELELLNLVLAKQVIPKHLPKAIVVLSLRGAGKESYASVSELGCLKAFPYDPQAIRGGHPPASTVFKF